MAFRKLAVWNGNFVHKVNPTRAVEHPKEIGTAVGELTSDMTDGGTWQFCSGGAMDMFKMKMQPAFWASHSSLGLARDQSLTQERDLSQWNPLPCLNY